MKYDSEILLVLNEAGAKGLSVKKIARHVFNSSNSFFDVVSFEEVHRYVAGFLNRKCKSANPIVERTDVRGVYRLNLSNESRQLLFDFKAEEGDTDNSVNTDDDGSLSLF